MFVWKRGEIMKLINRELLWNFVKRDLKARYMGTYLGFYWAIINPLILFVVYLIIFGFFFNIRLPQSTSVWDYSIYFSIGFFPWIFFNSAVLRGAQSVLDNINYVKKVSFQSEIFPLSITISEFVNLIIGFCIIIAVLAFKGYITWLVLMLPLILILQVLLTASLSVLFSAMSVFFRDLPQILNSLLLILFWLTPITYTVDMMPWQLHRLLAFNPLHGLISAYRSILFFGHAPDVRQLIITSLTISVLFVLSFLFFARTKRFFADVV